jgi:hypothetical protein
MGGEEARGRNYLVEIDCTREMGETAQASRDRPKALSLHSTPRGQSERTIESGSLQSSEQNKHTQTNPQTHPAAPSHHMTWRDPPRILLHIAPLARIISGSCAPHHQSAARANPAAASGAQIVCAAQATNSQFRRATPFCCISRSSTRSLGERTAACEWLAGGLLWVMCSSAAGLRAGVGQWLAVAGRRGVEDGRRGVSWIGFSGCVPHMRFTSARTSSSAVVYLCPLRPFRRGNHSEAANGSSG